MVRHQAIEVEPDTVIFQTGAQSLKQAHPVANATKYSLPSVPPSSHMIYGPWIFYSQFSWHGFTIPIPCTTSILICYLMV